MASLALALHAATARPRHGSCQTLITLTRRSLSVSRALHVLSSCVLCAWRRLPLICWKLLVGVCDVYETGLLLQFAYIALLLLPLSFGVRAPSLSLVGFIFVIEVRSGSPWLIVILMVRCCFGGLCVRDRLAACLRMSHFCYFR